MLRASSSAAALLLTEDAARLTQVNGSGAIVSARLKTSSVLLCATPPHVAGTVAVRISLNGWDFTPADQALTYTYDCGSRPGSNPMGHGHAHADAHATCTGACTCTRAGLSYTTADECVVDTGCGYCAPLPTPPSTPLLGSAPREGTTAPADAVAAHEGRCLPRGSTCAGDWITETSVALSSASPRFNGSVAVPTAAYIGLALRVLPGTQLHLTVNAPAAHVTLHDPAGATRLASSTVRGSTVFEIAREITGARQTVRRGSGGGDESVAATDACNEDRRVLLHLRIDPNVQTVHSQSRPEGSDSSAVGPVAMAEAALAAPYTIVLNTRLAYQGFECGCEGEAEYVELRAPLAGTPLDVVVPGNTTNETTSANTTAAAEAASAVGDTYGAGVNTTNATGTANATNTTNATYAAHSVDGLSAGSNYGGQRCIQRPANATNVTAVGAPPMPPFTPSSDANGTNATSDAAHADLVNATNATAHDEDDGVNSQYGNFSEAGLDQLTLPYCDELAAQEEADASDDAADFGNTTSQANATETEACPAPPPPPVLDRVRYIRVCGLELHHGATVLREAEGAGAAWLRIVGGNGEMGAAWHAAPMQLAAGFDATFTLWLGQLTPQMPPRGAADATGLAFVVQADPRRTFAAGCPAGGLGFRADPEPRTDCYARITNAVAIAFYLDKAEIIRTDADFYAPLHAVYYPFATYLDDGRAHRVRITYTPTGGGHIQLFLDEFERPLLAGALALADHALHDDGSALVGFTASSGALTVELHEWHLSSHADA